MTTKLFIWGRPGSGKSTAARYISKVLEGPEWNIRSINDYPILLEMAKSGSLKVRLMENGGFDVRIPSTYDEVLQSVKEQIEEINREVHLRSKSLVTIEFSRNNYQSALEQLGRGFLEDAYLLFIHAHIDICMNRIYNRMKQPERDDDHPSVPEEIYETRFASDNIEHMELLKQNGPFYKVEIMPNMGPLSKFHKDLAEFITREFGVKIGQSLDKYDMAALPV